MDRTLKTGPYRVAVATYGDLLKEFASSYAFITFSNNQVRKTFTILFTINVT